MRKIISFQIVKDVPLALCDDGTMFILDLKEKDDADGDTTVDMEKSKWHQLPAVPQYE
jgi:hypothetical protein